MNFEEENAYCANCLHKYRCKEGKEIDDEKCMKNFSGNGTEKEVVGPIARRFPATFTYIHNARTKNNATEDKT